MSGPSERARFIVQRHGRETFVAARELKQLAERGLLERGDLVYHPTLGRWLYAREVEEIRPEMDASTALGRPAAPPVTAPSNPEAIAGFVLGVMGHLPLVGLFCCILGLYLSSRGIRRAAELGSRGQGLAVAGMVLSILFLVPATACSALLVSALLSPAG
jgi:hypothetical protein